ncbi:hypothetical protein A6R68_03184, partial [Neotoma lepida]
VKQFLLLLGPHQVVSQIIVQPGLNTIDNKQHTMPRQVPKECRSILQHLRFCCKKQQRPISNFFKITPVLAETAVGTCWVPQ